MRLIDADSVKEKFMSDAFREMVDNEPTAYDVEKVEKRIDLIFVKVIEDARKLLGKTTLGKGFSDVLEKVYGLVKLAVRSGGEE